VFQVADTTAQAEAPEPTNIGHHSLEMVEAELARRTHLDFMRYLWQRKHEPFIIGRHTREICAALDRAMERFAQGISTYLAIMVPFRHGKSDILSRYFPANFLGRYPDKEIIVAAYTSSLARTFSRFARGIVRDPRYHQVYPSVSLSAENASIDVWGMHNEDTGEGVVMGQDLGQAHWLGIGGSVTGKGGSLIIVDDFFKGREEAESVVMRDKVWDSLSNEVMTRTAPVCIFIILATPWHQDDPFGRIKAKMAADPNFPRFEMMHYPAFGTRVGLDYEYLFPERFDPQWYLGQEAVLGLYGTASLLQCDPMMRAANSLATEKLENNLYDELPEGIPLTRGWDLASTEMKERTSPDPDYTTGVRLGVRWLPSGIEGEPVADIWVDDFIEGRWEAPERDAIIKATAIADGTIPVGVEAIAGYKDAAKTLARVLRGLRIVQPVTDLPGSKQAKADLFAPALYAGNCHMRRAKWNGRYIQWLKQFPGGHDDAIDGTAVAYVLHKPGVLRCVPSYGGATAQFNIDWTRRETAAEAGATLQYVAVHMTADGSVFVVGCLWDDVRGVLWVYDCLESHMEIDRLARALAEKFRLRTARLERMMGNDDLIGKGQSAGVQLNQSLAAIPVQWRVRPCVRYDPYGATVMMTRLADAGTLIVHERAAAVASQLLSWGVVKGKPEEGVGVGYCLALGMVACELRRRATPAPPAKKRIDYVRSGGKVEMARGRGYA
jgi:phage terminase large subunit-like protein